MSDLRRVVIWGASGHASVVADIIRAEGQYQVAGLLDDVDPYRQVAFGRVLGGRDQLPKVRASGVHHLVIGIGDNTVRRELAAYAQELGFELVSVVHPRATLAAGVVLGAGTVVMAGAVINPGTRVGRNVIVNTCASVDHDCVLGDAVHVCPGTHLAGNVAIGNGTFIGIGSVVRDRVRIGAECVVGAGSVVIEDLGDRVLAYGSPARVVQPARLNADRTTISGGNQTV